MSPFWAGVFSVILVVATVWNVLIATQAMRYRNETKAAIAEHRGYIVQALRLIQKAQKGQPITDENIVEFQRRDP